MTRIRKVRLSERGVYEPAMSEEQILNVIVQELWLRYRIKVWRINCPVGGKVRPNTRGIPDLMGWVKFPHTCSHALSGSYTITAPLFIEVKKPGGRRRIEQLHFIDEAKRDNCFAIFAESWEDVERELNGWGIRP